MRNADRWEALEVRHLRAFATIVEEGTFAGAARELGYTQSAVSQQLLALERIVGAPVLLRHPGGRRPLELTDAGRVVLAHAEPLLARVKAAQSDVASLVNGEVGRIAVGTFQSFGARILPPVLARFRSTCPGVEVAIQATTDVNELHAAVEAGELDACFSVLPIKGDGPFEVRELMTDPYVLLGAKRLRDLDGARVLLSCDYERHLVEARLLADGVTPAGYTRLDDNGMIHALAAAGEGIAVVPRLCVDPADDSVHVEPLPALPPRRLVAVWHRDRTLGPSARAFLDAAAAVCAAFSPLPPAQGRARAARA
jgi:molybdate transport repressor ModE-like protein